MTDALAGRGLDLPAIEARLKAATPGPWRTVAIPADESELAVAHHEDHEGHRLCGEAVEHVDLFREYVPLVPVAGQHRPAEGINVFSADMAKPQQENVACLVHVTESDPNVVFIREAPSDVAGLLAACRALREALQHLTESCEQVAWTRTDRTAAGVREEPYWSFVPTDAVMRAMGVLAQTQDPGTQKTVGGDPSS